MQSIFINKPVESLGDLTQRIVTTVYSDLRVRLNRSDFSEELPCSEDPPQSPTPYTAESYSFYRSYSTEFNSSEGPYVLYILWIVTPLKESNVRSIVKLQF